jgi:hypothetical protein
MVFHSYAKIDIKHETPATFIEFKNYQTPLLSGNMVIHEDSMWSFILDFLKSVY